ncbi:MAG TPA: hypothetical protein VGP25_04220 [Gemmatimonadaceae bacterium]|jgi:hypothetical protein|nr:hypothetical protein [Gemmatimonadaceae bacterium]
MRSITIRLVLLAMLSTRLGAQSPTDHLHETHVGHPSADSSFDAMQRRGRAAMGVDQYTSIHQFEDLADGGRIVLQRDRDDSAGTATIRAHMREIARAFSSGDFTTPATVHLKTVPGAGTMRARRRSIRYEPLDLPRGGALRITTTDPAAIAAIHDFLAFQRGEHRVPAK